MAATQVIKTANGTGFSINGFPIDPTGIQTGQALVWNGGSFIPGNVGGSTGNFGFFTNTLDLLSTGTMVLGGTHATAIQLGSTANAVVLLDSNGASGSGFTKTWNNLYLQANDATAGVTLQNSPGLFLWPRYWNGSASTAYDVAMFGVMDSVTPSAHIGMNFAGAEKFKFDSAGIISPGGGTNTGQVGFTTGRFLEGHFATTFSDAFDRDTSGTLTIGATTATATAIGKASGTVYLGGSSGSSGAGSTTTWNNIILQANAATAGTTLQNSAAIDLSPQYWTGATNLGQDILVLGVMDSTAPSYHLGFKFGGAEKFQFTNAGVLNIVAAGSIGNIAQAGTGSSALTIAPNVVNGSGSVGLVINTQTGLFRNVSAKILSIQNAGTEILSLQEDGVANAVFLATRSLYSFTVQAAVSNQFYASAADGASAVSLVVDTNTAWSNATAKLQSWRTNGSEKAYITAAGNLNLASGATIGNVASGGLFIGNGNTTIVGFGQNIRPNTDDFYFSGDSTHRWIASYSYWQDTKLGAQLTAATTITPTCGLHHVTGATTITIIALTNVPTSGNVTLTLIADSTITFGSSASAGGIKVAPGTTLASGKAMIFALDSSTSLWYPVQGA